MQAGASLQLFMQGRDRKWGLGEAGKRVGCEHDQDHDPQGLKRLTQVGCTGEKDDTVGHRGFQKRQRKGTKLVEQGEPGGGEKKRRGG